MVGCVDNMGDVKIIFIILFVYVMKVFLGINVIKLIIVFRICVEIMEFVYQILVVIYVIVQRFGQDKIVVIEMFVFQIICVIFMEIVFNLSLVLSVFVY